METPAIKTDFIPKTSINHGKSRSFNNLFFILAIVFFFLSIFIWGGLTGYEYLIKEEKRSLEITLSKKVEENVDKEFIKDLEIFDNKLKAIKDLLDDHTSIAVLLDLIKQDTLTNSVRYSDFSYSANDGMLVVTLSGEAKSFASLSFQKKVLLENPKITDPVFDSFNINEEGFISFNLTYLVEPKVASFSEKIKINE